MRNRRDIIFRAKRIDNGEWVVGSLVYDRYVDLYRMVTDLHEAAPTVAFDTICQYTGQKDRNGRLLFENDIVKGCTSPIYDDLYFLQIIWVRELSAFAGMAIKNPKSFVADLYHGEIIPLRGWNPTDWEIIGNEFDNLELLIKEQR